MFVDLKAFQMIIGASIWAQVSLVNTLFQMTGGLIIPHVLLGTMIILATYSNIPKLLHHKRVDMSIILFKKRFT